MILYFVVIPLYLLLGTWVWGYVKSEFNYELFYRPKIRAFVGLNSIFAWPLVLVALFIAYLVFSVLDALGIKK